MVWIKIIGHTDSNKISSVRFPSNWHLSVERARAAAALVKQGMSQPERISVEGKGDTSPIDDNKTAEGRARNRRVEFLIVKTETGPTGVPLGCPAAAAHGVVPAPVP